MKLSTGKVGFPIEFDNGDKQTIYFNPNDPDLMIRMRGLQKNIENEVNEIADIALKNDGTPVHDSYIDAFESLQNVVKKELDWAFGGEVSSVVFKHCSPFAIVNGEYFVIQFVQAIVPEIEKHIKLANAAAEKRMAKHIEKYRK